MGVQLPGKRCIMQVCHLKRHLHVARSLVCLEVLKSDWRHVPVTIALPGNTEVLIQAASMPLAEPCIAQRIPALTSNTNPAAGISKSQNRF